MLVYMYISDTLAKGAQFFPLIVNVAPWKTNMTGWKTNDLKMHLRPSNWWVLPGGESSFPAHRIHMAGISYLQILHFNQSSIHVG